MLGSFSNTHWPFAQWFLCLLLDMPIQVFKNVILKLDDDFWLLARSSHMLAINPCKMKNWIVFFHLVGCLFTVLSFAVGGSSAFPEAVSELWVFIEDLLQFELIFLTHETSGIGFILRCVDIQLSQNRQLDLLILDQKIHSNSKRILWNAMILFQHLRNI